MKNELEELSQIICTASIEKTVNEIENNLPSITGTIVFNFAQCCSTTEKESYAHLHQRSITNLLDSVSRQESSKQNVMLLSALRRFRSLYHFLRRVFGKFWSGDMPVPIHFRVQNIPLLTALVKEAKQRFEVANVPPQVAYSILSPIKGFVNTTICSWQRFKYMYHYHRRLKRLLRAPQLTPELIGRFLLVSEFSPSAFLKYFVAYAHAGCPPGQHPRVCILYYSQLLKRVKQLVAEPAPNTRRQVLESIETATQWLKAEIRYLIRHQKLGAPANTHKLLTRLSVSELSVGVRVLFDAKVFKIDHMTELVRLVAQLIRTEGSAEISEDSIINKARDCETSTLARVRNEMTEMLALVKTY